MKPSYPIFSEDLKQLAIKVQRAAYANKCLSFDDYTKATTDYSNFAMTLANKYGTRAEILIAVAISVSESCNLGLNY